jgi:formylglycine-generating enzyme required for sulfatase activity
MTARAQTARTLAVFVGGDNTISSSLTTQLRTNLTSGGRYTLTSVGTADKLTELQATYTAGGGSSINRDALATWGREKGISAICLVVDDKKGNDHLFSAQLIGTKDSKLEGRGSYTRTDVAAGDAVRVALALSKQLEGPGRKYSVNNPAHAYPAEMDIEMVFVDGGSFEMGCDDVRDGSCNNGMLEKPVHTVEVSNFYIGRYEVTRAQWLAVMKGHPTFANPGMWRDDDQLPIDSISWDAIAGTNGFLERLNKMTGKKYRLPTEAEWEYAARGGKHKSPYRYSGSNNLTEVAWCATNSTGRTYVVGGRNPNALGIYDMSGNVFELCSDWHGAYPSTAQKDPTGPASGSVRVMRGGRSANNPEWHRVACRNTAPPSDRWYGKGFRVALPAQ